MHSNDGREEGLERSTKGAKTSYKPGSAGQGPGVAWRGGLGIDQKESVREEALEINEKGASRKHKGALRAAARDHTSNPSLPRQYTPAALYCS